MNGFIRLSILLGLLTATISHAQIFNPADCNFLCQEIPKPQNVMSDWGRAGFKELTSPTLKVLAWNIYKGRKQLFSQDFQKLSNGADIVMISEATDGTLVKPSLDMKSGYQWVMATAWIMKRDNMRTGLVTGSYALPLGAAYTRTTDLEPFVKSPKVTLLTKYYHAPTQQEILTVNIHGINWVDDAAFERQIRSVEPYLKAHVGPILFAGDFNIKKDTNRLEIVKTIVAKYGMTRVPWSNPNSQKQYDDAFSRGFQIHRSTLVNTVVDRSSDHPAMYFELTPIKAKRW